MPSANRTSRQSPSLARTSYTSFNNRVRELQSKLPIFQPDCGELVIIPLVVLQGYTEPSNEWQLGFSDAITHVRKQSISQSQLSTYHESYTDTLCSPCLTLCSPPILAIFHKEEGFPIPSSDSTSSSHGYFHIEKTRSLKFLLQDLLHLLPLGKIDKFGDILVKYGLNEFD